MKPEPKAPLPSIEELLQEPGWVVLPDGALLWTGGVAGIEFTNCWCRGDAAGLVLHNAAPTEFLRCIKRLEQENEKDLR